jgi:hypothetical protein
VICLCRDSRLGCPAEQSEADESGVEDMTNKSKGMGLGIALGAALGIVLGVMAGHIALWLGIGVAIGIAIGSTLRRTTCAHCEAAKRNQELGARS